VPKSRTIHHAFEPVLVHVAQAAAMLDTTERNIRNKLREGRLIAVKDGTRTLVTVESIHALATSLPRAEFTPLPRKDATS
jgi:hypothetical protein